MRWERAPAVLGLHVDERCLAQAFKGIQAARRRPAKRPSTVTQRYFRRVLVKLGVCNPRVWWDTRAHCLNARPKLRRTTDTWLIDYVVWQVTQPAREKRFDHMLAVRRQLRKALSQMAPDEGSWTRATWVIPPEDPLSLEEGEGDEQELVQTHSYMKALRAVKTQKMPDRV